MLRSIAVATLILADAATSVNAQSKSEDRQRREDFRQGKQAEKQRPARVNELTEAMESKLEIPYDKNRPVLYHRIIDACVGEKVLETARECQNENTGLWAGCGIWKRLKETNTLRSLASHPRACSAGGNARWSYNAVLVGPRRWDHNCGYAHWKITCFYHPP